MVRVLEDLTDRPRSARGVFASVLSHNEAKGMVPLVYLIGLVAMIFTALSYAEMSRAIPIAGSVYS